MTEFRFSTVQRKELILVALKTFPADLAETFLNEAQRIIGEWLIDYPTGSGDNKKSREGIERLATQIDKTHGDILLLTDDARNHLGAFWKHGYKRKGWPANINEIQCFLLELKRCTTDLIQPGGISKSIESDIAENLAWAFVDTFKKLPTTTPLGPFMSFLAHLSVNILTPLGRPIVFGKDLVADVLRHVKKRCNQYNEFIKS